MARTIVTLLFTVLYITIAPGQEDNECKIKLEFKNTDSSFVSIAYHIGNKQYIKDTIQLDEQGNAVYSPEVKPEQGLYMLVFPDNQLFEFILPEDQHFTVAGDKNDIMNTLVFRGSKENSAFIEYRKRWAAFQDKTREYSKMMNDPDQRDKNNESREKIREAQEEILDYIKTQAGEYEGTLLSAMLYSMLPVEVPDFNIPAGVSNPDSLKWVMGYNYNKNHFWDNLDLSDPRLIRTPILQNKLETFFSKVLIPDPDTIMKEIPQLVSMTGGNEETYRYVISHMFNHFSSSQVMGHDEVVLMLADNYYLNGEADWVSDKFLEDLKNDAARIRPNIIGKEAVNLTMQTYAGIPRSLHDIKADYTILYFWEPNCGHCKTSTPVLKELYENNRDKGIEVFAVCTQDNRDEWEQYIAENELSWINAWDPDRSTHFDFYYNVMATPMIYILNSEKEIIAKKIPADRVMDFIDSYKRIKGSN